MTTRWISGQLGTAAVARGQPVWAQPEQKTEAQILSRALLQLSNPTVFPSRPDNYSFPVTLTEAVLDCTYGRINYQQLSQGEPSPLVLHCLPMGVVLRHNAPSSIHSPMPLPQHGCQPERHTYRQEPASPPTADQAGPVRARGATACIAPIIRPRSCSCSQAPIHCHPIAMGTPLQWDDSPTSDLPPHRRSKIRECVIARHGRDQHTDALRLRGAGINPHTRRPHDSPKGGGVIP